MKRRQQNPPTPGKEFAPSAAAGRRAGTGKDRRVVTALARGLAILRAFESSSDRLGNGEIAQRTGLPKPTVSRLTYTLTQLGYLSYFEEREQYALGSAVMALGMAFFRANSFPQTARPFLQSLADEVQCVVALFQRDGLDCVVVKLFTGATQNIAVQLTVGSRVPIDGAITGMAMIAALPVQERARLLATLRRRNGARWPELQARIERASADLRARGYATGIGLWHKDINSISTPLFAQESGELYVVSVSGPAFITGEKVLRERVGPRLVATTEEMCRLDLCQRPLIAPAARS